VEDSLRRGPPLALKELGDPRAGESLAREFATLAALRHPNLVEVYDLSLSTETGLPCFSLEHVEGADIVTAGRRHGAALVLDLAIEALRALSFLHDFGLLHRDLKPGNLLVRDTPRLGCRLVVLDFGLSDRNDPEREAGAGAVGTLSYMAPELLEGAAASRRTDLYALGAVLYEAVHGRPPFTVKSQDIGAFLRSVREGKRMRPPLPDGYPQGFAGWLDELLSPDPTLRPPDANEALGRLNAALGTDHPFETAVTRAARLASGEPPGRRAEIEAVWSALELSGSSPRLVWLAGAAGSGKSRLLRWLASDAVRQGLEVFSPPSGAASEKGGFDVASLRERAKRGSTLVILDELEAASSELADFVDRVAREGKEAPLRVVAAVRPNEIRDPRIKSLVRDTGIVPTLARVDLEPLSFEAVRAVAERAAGSVAVSEARTGWLLETSEGDAQTLENLLVEGIWEMGARARRTFVPRTSRAARLDLLSPDGTAWLEALSVLGADSSERSIAAVAQLDDAAAYEASRDVEASGLARRSADRWSPESRSLSDEVRKRIAPDRLRDLSNLAARALADFDGDAADPWRLAQLNAGAGESERAMELAIEAADRAHARNDPTAVSDRLAFAIALMSRRDPRRGPLRARQGEALLSAGANAAAARAFAGALLSAKDEPTRVHLLLRRAFALALAMQSQQSRLTADRALELARKGGFRNEEAEAKRIVGFGLTRIGSEREALKWLEDAVERFGEKSEPRARAEALRDLGLCQSNLRIPEAVEALGASAELWRSIGEDAEELRSLLGLARDLMRHGNLDQARDLLENISTRARTAKNQRMLQFALSLLSSIASHQTRLDVALATAAEAADGALYLGNVGAVVSSRNNHAAALIACGQPTEAAALLRATLSKFSLSTEPEGVDYSRMILASSLLKTHDPNDPHARQLIETAIQNGRERKSWRQLLFALAIEMERRATPGCSDPIESIRAEYDALLETSGLESDAEIVVRAELATSAVLSRRGEAERAYDAALKASQRARDSDLIAYAALSQVRLSEALNPLGRSEEAREAIALGKELLDRCADRIKDPDVRRMFLERPEFKPLSDSRRPGSDESRLGALYEIIHTVNSGTEPETVLASILDLALQVLQAERGMILLRDSESDEFTVRLARNLDKETVANLDEFSRGIVAKAGKGEPVLAIDAGNDARFDQFASIGLYGIRSLLCVPLRSRSKIIGTVYLDSRREGRLFTEADLKFLGAFADHAALALQNVQARARLLEENRRLQLMAEKRVQFENIVGRSPAMQKVFDLIPRVAASEQPVLIQGESGTGKELVARAIHLHGPRKLKIFLSENCAALAETLLESELFGHVRGAFTGAEKDHPGLFEQASGGTLFLDEIGDMSAAMQARLLRVLQEGEVRRVGGERSIKVDVRVLAATHRDLQAEVQAGRFREDLMYRLQVLFIHLPPLRERPGDIPLLVHHILDRISRERGRPAPVVDPEVMTILERYSWPGNVRQLENALHRLVIYSRDDVVSREAIEADSGLRQMLLGPEREPLFSLERTEKAQIQRALEACKGNREKAAKLLGISRATIYRKIREYKLE
jgi:Nif-specific regulatory protein